MTAADQSAGALTIMLVVLLAALPVVAGMAAAEWHARRRDHHRFTRPADDMPLVVPRSVRVWSPDMDRHEDGPAVRLVDARPREIVDCEAVGWVIRDSVDTTTITRAARRIR